MKPWEETWQLTQHGKSSVVTDSYGAVIVEKHEYTGANQARQTAALVSAAPELYRALHLVFDALVNKGLEYGYYARLAKAALAKARGECPT